ncbi:MAG: short-chain dehydrogenase/reductase [Subtercola sp.]|nr:short-chain dehydrogenase/reductase [Subtercola sp.]
MLALITGGTNGIGADAVKRLAARGDQVIFTGRDEERGRRLVESLPGDGHSFARLEAGDEAGWRNVLERYISDRPLDVLILNAGANSSVAGSQDPIELLDSENFERMLGVNVRDVVIGLRLSLPYLYRATAPKVIVTSSIAGLLPNHRDPVYSAAKAASIAFVRSVAPALAARGVTITAVCPGATFSGITSPEFVEESPDGTLISKRTGSPIQSPERVSEMFEQLIESSVPGDVWVVDIRTPIRVFEAPELWPGKLTV